MKIVLTGGTGFIGSHFLKHALAKNYSVLAIRRSSDSQPRIPLDREPIWLDRQLSEVSSKELEGCDVLVHLAAHTGNVPYDNLHNCMRWNVIEVISLFEKARLSGIKRFVVAGTCFEYGRSGERFESIPTDAPLEPTNSYAASKASASIALSQWASQHSLSLDILRIFHVFGEGELSSRFWPSLRQAALAEQDFPMTEGAQVRDFLLVDDAASIFLERALMPPSLVPNVNILNVSSGDSQTIRSFADFWWNKWNAKGSILYGKLPYRPNEVMSYVPGPDLIIPTSTIL